MASQVERFYDYVDVKENQDAFIQRLAVAVGYPSISSDQTEEGRQHVIDMGQWLHGQLAKFVAKPEDAKLVDLGNQGAIKLPPLVLVSIGDDVNKKTVLVYGHYDVQPVSGWEEANPNNPDPFKLGVESDGRLVGRGSTDDKGPIMGWLNVLEAHQSIAQSQSKTLNDVLPANIRFMFEGMEEADSTGLDDWINNEVTNPDKGWFKGIDCVCITDNYWLTTYQPALTYGLRGIAYFSIHIKGATNDLHSGSFGRMVHEPMTDLVKLFGKLVEADGTIFKAVEEMVPPPTDEERAQYAQLHYTVADLQTDTGNPVELSEDHTQLVMGRMRYPSLSIHGIQGAPTTVSTVIPHEIWGRFSIRLVHPQTPQVVQEIVSKFLSDEFDKLSSKNVMEVIYEPDGMPWVGNKDHWNFRAADAATQAVYNLAPDYTREGGSIPITLTIEKALDGANVLLMPMGRSDDGAHSLHEKIDKENYIKGTKLFGTYLYELAKV